MGRGMAEAIGRSANTIAGYMGQSVQDTELQRQRQQDKLDQIRLTAELRDPKTGSGPPALTEQQMDEETAGRLGTTVADVQRTRGAVKTGDTSAFREKKSGKVEGPDGTVHDWETNDYPPGFEDQFQSKVKALYDVRDQLRLGKDYKDVASGRETQQKVGQVEGIIGGTMDSTKVGEAQAAVKGEGAFKVTENLIGNQFTGEAKPTAVGNAKINDLNQPDAGPAATERASQRAAITQERIAADNEAERIRKEKGEALSKAYSVKAREKVEADFAVREKANQDKLADIESRLKAVNGGPATKSPAATGGFEGFKIRKIR